MDTGPRSGANVRTCIGDLLSDDAEALVNPVNCMGLIEPRLAGRIRSRWPEHLRAYLALCRKRRLEPGLLLVTQAADTGQRLIAFPAHRHWSETPRLDDIDAGLLTLRQLLSEGRIASIAIPPIGCGIDGLDWHRVRLRIVAALGRLGVELRLYEPIPEVPALRQIA